MLRLSDIKEILSNVKSLPGKKSQYKMAPSNRDLLLQTTCSNKSMQSAVLLLVFEDNGVAKFVLIKRPVYNGPHSGQMALPGGKYEEKDIRLSQTAVRECFEETGVKTNVKDIVLELSPLVIPKTGMNVYPFVSVINFKPDFKINQREVASLFTPEVNILFDKSIVKTYKKGEVLYPYYDIENQKVWGATAMILSEFSDLLTMQ